MAAVADPKDQGDLPLEDADANMNTKSAVNGVDGDATPPVKSPKEDSVTEPESAPSKEGISPKKSSYKSPKKSPPCKSPNITNKSPKESKERSPKKGAAAEEPPALPPRGRKPQPDQPKEEKPTDPGPEDPEEAEEAMEVTGATGGVKEGATGGVEKRVNGGIAEGATGGVEKRANGVIAEGATGGLDEPDWQRTRTVRECLKYIKQQDMFTDITFTFGGDPNVKISGHKLVLSMRSKVFEDMLFGKTAMNAETIQLDDDPETFKMILGFVYNDEISLTGETVVGCLTLARKYQLSGLIMKCEVFINAYLSSDTMLDVYTKCKEASLDNVVEKCFELMLEYGDRLLAPGKDIVRTLPRDLFQRLVSSDDLSCDEINVFEAALDWARYQREVQNKFQEPCDLRNELGDILFQVRFPVMSAEMIADKIVPSEILTSEELAMLTEYIRSDDKSPDMKKLGPFSTVKRPGNGIVHVELPHPDDLDITSNLSNTVLVIFTDNSVTHLQRVAGKGLNFKEPAVGLGEDLDGPFIDCPVLSSEHSVVFTPPVPLKCNTTNVFKFPSTNGSRRVSYSRRIREGYVSITHKPVNVDRIELGFYQPQSA